jgi:hypothetical protein
MERLPAAPQYEWSQEKGDGDWVYMQHHERVTA